MHSTASICDNSIMEVLSATVISYGMWFILHNVFNEVFARLIFKRTNDCRMPVISWELLFNAFCTMTCLNCLPINEILTDFALSNDHLSSNISCAFMIGGFIHSVSLNVSLKGINSSSFWRQMSLALFSSSAFKLGCLEFYFKVVLLISVMDQFLWLIRALHISEKTDAQKSWILSIIASSYCFLWSFVYLFVFPVFLLLPVAFTRTNSDNIPHLLLLNLSLWICFFCELINSPSLQVIKEMFLCQTVNVDLFSFKGNQLTRSTFVLLKKQLEKEKLKVERLQKLVPQSDGEPNKKMSSATLIKTVKCFLAVKRRLKNVREKTQSEDGQESEKIFLEGNRETTPEEESEEHDKPE